MDGNLQEAIGLEGPQSGGVLRQNPGVGKLGVSECGEAVGAVLQV